MSNWVEEKDIEDYTPSELVTQIAALTAALMDIHVNDVEDTPEGILFEKQMHDQYKELCIALDKKFT